jgi:hypothetical protein
MTQIVPSRDQPSWYLTTKTLELDLAGTRPVRREVSALFAFICGLFNAQAMETSVAFCGHLRFLTRHAALEI